MRMMNAQRGVSVLVLGQVATMTFACGGHLDVSCGAGAQLVASACVPGDAGDVAVIAEAGLPDATASGDAGESAADDASAADAQPGMDAQAPILDAATGHYADAAMIVVDAFVLDSTVDAAPISCGDINSCADATPFGYVIASGPTWPTCTSSYAFSTTGTRSQWFYTRIDNGVENPCDGVVGVDVQSLSSALFDLELYVDDPALDGGVCNSTPVQTVRAMNLDGGLPGVTAQATAYVTFPSTTVSFVPIAVHVVAEASTTCSAEGAWRFNVAE